MKCGIRCTPGILHGVREAHRSCQAVASGFADEVQGKSLLNLDIGLPTHELRSMVRGTLAGDDAPNEVTLDAVNRRGKKIKCRVSSSPLVTAGKKRDGVILMMEEV